MNALLDKNSLLVQSALGGAAAAGAALAYGYIPGMTGSTLMQSAAIGAGGALGGMLGGDAASDADRYKRTAIIAAGGAAGAYLTDGSLAMGALAAAAGHVAVQTALFYPVATIGPFLL